MADTQIDELRLDITVKDNTDGKVSSAEKVENLATAISHLIKPLRALNRLNFDGAKFSKTFGDMAKGIDPFVAKIEKVSGALESLATIVKKSGLDKAVKEATGQLSPTGKETVSTGDGESKPIQAKGGQAEPLGNIKKQLDGVNKELDKTAKKSEKAKKPLGQLLKSFGRIAMYRAVRRTIQEITQAFMESIDGIARYNDEFRSTMGNLQSSMSKAKASIGVAFYQVLIALEPLITQIANVIVNLANSISKVIANLRGEANYIKINIDYWKKYQSAAQGVLLTFDSFTTLGSQGIDYSKMFIKATDALEEDKFSGLEGTIKSIFEIITELWNTIKQIGESTWEIIEPLLPTLKEIIVTISQIISKVIHDLTPALKSLAETISGIFDAIKNIFGIFSGDSETRKSSASGFLAGLGKAAKGVFDFFGNIGKTMINAFSKLLGFADGGMMTRNAFSGAGTMYALAGESGAEVVAQGSAGTGVLNVDQFADAMVSALVRYGAARDTGNGTTIVLDGNKVGQLVASNVGFRNEANRRNANLNWK